MNSPNIPKGDSKVNEISLEELNNSFDEVPPTEDEEPPLPEEDGMVTSPIIPTPMVQLKKLDYHDMTNDVMSGVVTRWPPFFVKLHLLTDIHGISLILCEENGVVRHVSETYVDGLIYKYWKYVNNNGISLPIMTADDATKTRRIWMMACLPLEEDPRAIAWKSEQCLTYERVPFDPILPPNFDADEQMPYFARILSRLEDDEAVCAWIGSLFDHKSARQQYVWIQGEGGSGKSSFVNVLLKVFKSSGQSEQAPGKQPSQFWTSGLLGKRLVVFPDTTDSEFVTSGLFKALTGEDPVRIEQKGKQPFTADLTCKFLYHGNGGPAIGNNRADLRRIIFTRMANAETLLPNYIKTLEEESELFISYCWDVYQHVTKGDPRADIPTKCELAHEVAEDNDEYYESIFEICFKVSDDPHSYVISGDVTEALNRVKAHSKYQDQKFRQWLSNHPSVTRERTRKKGVRTVIYSGIIKKV